MHTAESGSTSDPLLERFVAAFLTRCGAHVDAIVLYGSYQRGKRDMPLDFYLLLDDYRVLGRWAGWANRLLPPNVYHIELDGPAGGASAKYATVTTRDFEHAIERDVTPYFWARFAQPSVTLYVRNAALAERIQRARQHAVLRMLATTAPLIPGQRSARELWCHALALTYRCELRAEDGLTPSRLYTAYAPALDAASVDIAVALGWPACGENCWQVPPATHPERARLHWQLRRVAGKVLAAVRLVKAAFTFNDPLAYVAWKVARHSGIEVTPTPRQRRYPLLFGWRVLWRLWRRGGFR